MAIPRIICRRARRAGLPLVARSHDKVNAYGSGNHQARIDALPAFIGRSDIGLFVQRRRELTARIEAIDGPVWLRLGCGGPMGDGNEGELFMRDFYDCVQSWHTQPRPARALDCEVVHPH